MRYVTEVRADDDRNIYIHFAVVDERGAIHFHFRIDETPFPGDDRLCCAGVETHFASAPDYMQDQRPSRDKCWLLDAPCWHDGTSLWASEHWVPGFKRGGTAWVWRELERCHAKEFGAQAGVTRMGGDAEGGSVAEGHSTRSPEAMRPESSSTVIEDQQ